MPPLPDVDPTAKFSFKPGKFVEVPRSIVGVSLGPHVDGVALPHPDGQAPDSALAAGIKRMAIKPLAKANADLVELAQFALEFCERNFVPLSPDVDLSFESWIDGRPYPEWRKKELREVHDKMAKFTLKEKYTVVKCFLKDETYPEFKHARGIYARADEFKCVFGPLVSSIEEQVYKHPSFIKKIPVPDRPAYIRDRLVDQTNLKAATDFTSMEASFDPEVLEALDFVMFSFFLRHMPSVWWVEVVETLAQENHCSFKWFMMKVLGRRMSGEMNTSLSNGFANLVIIEFLCHKYKCGKPRSVVEGDDSLFSTESGRFPDPGHYTKIGFRVKFEKHSDFTRASFCGLIFDDQDLVNVTDIQTVLCEFGWASARYANCRSSRLKTLFRSKALSYLHQYYGCPVIQAMALYGLRMTRGYDLRDFVENDRGLSLWEREQLREALGNCKVDIKSGRDVPIRTRLMVEDVFGIPVETQLELEQMFNDKNDLEPLVLGCFNFPRDWVRYGMSFIVPRDAALIPQNPMDLSMLIRHLGAQLTIPT